MLHSKVQRLVNWRGEYSQNNWQQRDLLAQLDERIREVSLAATVPTDADQERRGRAHLEHPGPHDPQQQALSAAHHGAIRSAKQARRHKSAEDTEELPSRRQQREGKPDRKHPQANQPKPKDDAEHDTKPIHQE